MPDASIQQPNKTGLYCPRCQQEVKRPLVCGDCLAVICRECGGVLERAEDLGIG